MGQYRSEYKVHGFSGSFKEQLGLGSRWRHLEIQLSPSLDGECFYPIVCLDGVKIEIKDLTCWSYHPTVITPEKE